MKGIYYSLMVMSVAVQGHEVNHLQTLIYTHALCKHTTTILILDCCSFAYALWNNLLC